MTLWSDEKHLYLNDKVIVVVTHSKNNERYYMILDSKYFDENREEALNLVCKKGAKAYHLTGLQEWLEEINK